MEHFETTIQEIRSTRGGDLAILGHHYQSDAVIRHCDITGDSLELARKITGLEAKYIVFCGVWFMAESAAILRRPDQKIFTPAPDATCPMADMALPGAVEKVLNILGSTDRKIVPLTYVNSSAAVKAVVGRHGGSVCTSANAATMMRWAMERGDTVLFLPDMHLAMNTANALGIPESERHVLNRMVIAGDPDLCVKADEAEGKRLVSWPGYCPVHHEFTLKAIRNIRETTPGARVAVHPECPPAVTSAADGNGSTSFLIRYAAEVPAGSALFIATEANLVNRLAARHTDKTILPLEHRVCDDMGKTTEENLCAALATLDTAEPVDVPDDVREPARLALERMLAACA